MQNGLKHVGRRSAAHRRIEILHVSAVGYARTIIVRAKKRTLIRPAGTVRSAAAAFATVRVASPTFADRMCATRSSNASVRKTLGYASAISGKRRLRANEEEEPNPVPSAGSLARRPVSVYVLGGSD